MTDCKKYIINGVVILSWYAGLDVYCVDGKEFCDLGSLAQRVGVDVETLKEEMWKQR